MEDNGVETFIVQIIINGFPKSYEFALEPEITIETVKNEMRSTFNVTNGTLSSCNDRLVYVSRFVAGGVYYFIEFSSGEVNHYFSYRIIYFYKPISLFPSN